MTYEVAIGVLLRLEAAAIKQDSSTLVLSTLDKALDLLLRLWADDWTEISTLLKATVNRQSLGSLGDLWHPVLSLANHDEGAESHTSLASSTESGTSDGIESVVLVAVWKDRSVVLSAQVSLNTLAIGRATGEDVLAGLVATNEGDGLDAGLIDDEVDGLGGTVDDVDDAWWEASLLSELREDHACTWVTLRGLDDKGVTGHGGDWNGPEGNHSWEVEWADGSRNTEWFSVLSCLHILGDLEDLAGKLARDATSVLSNLQTTENITLGISKGLALFQGDAGSKIGRAHV